MYRATVSGGNVGCGMRYSHELSAATGRQKIRCLARDFCADERFENDVILLVLRVFKSAQMHKKIRQEMKKLPPKMKGGRYFQRN